MIDPARIVLEKAHKSLAGAESEAANGRYNNCANRCYYACFQAAVAALRRAGISPPGGADQWSHSSVASQFSGQLVGRRKIYSGGLRDTLPRLFYLRRVADYADQDVSGVQAARALGRAQEFVAAIADRVGTEGQDT